MNPQNVHMTVSGSMVSVGWELPNGQREHVWLEIDPARERRDFEGVSHGVPASPYRVSQGRLYRNPPDGTTFKGAGYFRTRYLDAAAKANAGRVQAALQIAESTGLYDAAIFQRDCELVERQEAADRAHSDALAHALKEHRAGLPSDHPWQAILATLQVEGDVVDRAALFRAISRQHVDL